MKAFSNWTWEKKFNLGEYTKYQVVTNRWWPTTCLEI